MGNEDRDGVRVPHEEVRGFYTQAERELFAATLAPVHGTRIWLGRFGQSDLTDCESRRLFARRRDGYSTTLVAGRLVIQVLTIRRPDMPLSIQQGPWPPFLRRIWPVDSTIHWPPPGSFTEASFQALTERFTIRR
jgi:hypothetical protein